MVDIIFSSRSMRSFDPPVAMGTEPYDVNFRFWFEGIPFHFSDYKF